MAQEAPLLFVKTMVLFYLESFKEQQYFISDFEVL